MKVRYMKKVLILTAIFFLSVVMISCGGDDSNSCMNENEERTMPCAADDTKFQRQVCSQGEWENDGICYLCKYSESRTITCAADDTKEQIQVCSQGEWVDEGGCICPENNKFCHFLDGLNWSDVSSKGMTEFDAVTYCEDLGGRLPTISELRTLVQNCPATETGGVCRVTDSCLSIEDCWNDLCRGCEYSYSGKYSVFGDTGTLWSSSKRSGDSGVLWYLRYRWASVEDESSYGPAHVRCVR